MLQWHRPGLCGLPVFQPQSIVHLPRASSGVATQLQHPGCSHGLSPCLGDGQAKLCSRGERGTKRSKGERASGGFAAVQLELTLVRTWQPFL